MRKTLLTIAAGLFTIPLLMISRVPASAQATPTPTATPTPGGCNIAPPGAVNGVADCATGAEEPPSFLGVSGGNFNSVAIDSKTGTTTCCTGTFGALVNGSDGKQYVLSTNHTLARSSGTKKAKVDELIVQPGLVDLGCWQDASDQVAQLSKWTTLNFKGVANELDAAIAEVVQAPVNAGGTILAPGIDPLGRTLNIGQISTVPYDYNNLTDGFPVMKMGRSSCLTTGRIDAFDAMGNVVYTGDCNAASSGTAFFDHQILVFGEALDTNTSCTFASTGDSGALVVTNDFTCPQAIGMVFAAAAGSAADSGGQIVAVNPIGTILDTGFKNLTLSLVGQVCTPSAFEQRVSAAASPTDISDALRASIAQIRKVKKVHGRKLLKKPGVAAVGIGAGDSADEAALNVYLTQDTPENRIRVLKEVKGTKVKFKHLAATFQAL